MICIVIFDLGGVLVKLDDQPLKPEWLGENVDFDKSWKTWLLSPSVQQFDRGKINADQFASSIIQELNLNVNRQDFLDWIAQWPKDFFDGVFSLLDQLRGKVELGLFSNITALHWPRYYETLIKHGAIDHFYASYIIGQAKPDISAFEYVLNDIDMDAKNILFLDDNQLNVNAARKVGFQAEKVAGVAGCLDVLKTYNII